MYTIVFTVLAYTKEDFISFNAHVKLYHTVVICSSKISGVWWLIT